MQIADHFLEAQKILDLFISESNNLKKIEEAAKCMVDSIKNNGKIISCGNGGSMCDAMHFAEELTGRFKEDRAAFPALSISDPSHITCVGNDYGFEYIFSRFIEAHGHQNDTLLAISTSGNSKNVINAIETAKKKGMKIVALTGKNGGEIKNIADIEIRAPHSDFADRAQELHIKIIHSFIDYIENHL